MKRGPQGRYTKELREEAVKMVVEEKLSVPEAARRLSLPPSTLTNWIKAYKEGKLGEVGRKYRPLTEIELELARTKKELAEVKMERDILKKRPRTLPGSRCTVCGNETDAAPLPNRTCKPDIEGIGQWLLCLAGQATL